jgi:hypothetical protein
VAVHDQDPDVVWLLAAKDGTDRGWAWRSWMRWPRPGGCARTGLGARSSGAPWTCQRRRRTRSTLARSCRPAPTPPPWSSTPTGRRVALLRRRVRRVLTWCGPSWCRRLLAPGSFPVLVSSRCSRPAWRPSCACWPRRPGSARPPCWPSGGPWPGAGGWPGCRWRRVTTTPPASGAIWWRRCGPSSQRWGLSPWRRWVAPVWSWSGWWCRRWSTT